MRLLRWLVFVLAACAYAGPAVAQNAGALRAQYEALRPQLQQSAFGRPLALQSSANSGHLKGDVFAALDHAFATVAGALDRRDAWCDILVLPVNTKQCRSSGAAGRGTITLAVAKTAQDPLEDAYRIAFRYAVRAQTTDYLQIALDADDGPFGTQNYHIAFEAAPIDAERTFIHFAYSYDFGLMARLGMEAYLSTSGSGKVGFTEEGRRADGSPALVGGLRGVIERNAMRYFLAIDAYLKTLGVPPPARLDARLRAWYAGIERYPAQLREKVTLAQYLALKHRDVVGQAATEGR